MDKQEILLLNKMDTEEGADNWHVWRTLYPDAIPISAKTGKGLPQLQEAVYRAVRGQQVDVVMEMDVVNGKLISFIESHTRVQEREFLDGRVVIRAIMGKQTLADLAQGGQVEVKTVATPE